MSTARNNLCRQLGHSRQAERAHRCGRQQSLQLLAAIALLVAATLHDAHAVTMFVRAAELEPSANGFCSLIEAMENANADAAVHADCPAGSGADTIVLATGSTYTLNAPVSDTVEGFLLGLPPVTTSMTLQGARAAIERSHAPGTPAFGVIGVAPTGKLTLRGLTITNSLSVVGAVFNVGSTMLVNSTLTGNGLGGGSFNRGALSIVNSSLTRNTNGIGGAFFNNGGSVLLLNSTLAENRSGSRGGAIFSSGGSVSVVNSTVSGNTAGGDGGAIFNAAGTLNIVNSTFSGNGSDAGVGAGVFSRNGTLNLTNVIIAGGGGDCVLEAGVINTNVNNFISDGSCGAAFSGDPMLAPLANNGGAAPTHALLPGSPAIDMGADCSKAPVKGRDQRALPRDSKCDIGAVEFETAGPTATLGSAPVLTRGGATKYLFTVIYRDNAAVDMSSVSNDDVSVQDATGNAMPVFLVGVSLSGNGTPRTATYQVIPPNGRWESSANAIYAIALNGGRVRDVMGNANVSASLGSFTVNIPLP